MSLGHPFEIINNDFPYLPLFGHVFGPWHKISKSGQKSDTFFGLGLEKNIHFHYLNFLGMGEDRPCVMSVKFQVHTYSPSRWLVVRKWSKSWKWPKWPKTPKSDTVCSRNPQGGGPPTICANEANTSTYQVTGTTHPPFGRKFNFKFCGRGRSMPTAAICRSGLGF